jgi:hypothetical protein
MVNVITASQRLAESHGIKLAFVGPPEVGKTHAIRMLDPVTTAFVDCDKGSRALGNWGGNILRVRSWEECRDIAVQLIGADPTVLAGRHYSRGHLADVGGLLEGYTTVVIDSVTEAVRMALHQAGQQPESFSERTGKRDTRGLYGWLLREVSQWLGHFRHADDMTVIFIVVLEQKEDDLGYKRWRMQLASSQLREELPSIVDEVITLQKIDFGDGNPARAFVCTSPNPWGYPTKDRSGRLEQLEEPNLAKLLMKLNGRV